MRGSRLNDHRYAARRTCVAYSGRCRWRGTQVGSTSVNRAYVNVPNAGMADWEREYYGSNRERLRQVKAKYDPENVFCFEQSIPPLPADPVGPPGGA